LQENNGKHHNQISSTQSTDVSLKSFKGKKKQPNKQKKKPHNQSVAQIKKQLNL